MVAAFRDISHLDPVPLIPVSPWNHPRKVKTSIGSDRSAHGSDNNYILHRPAPMKGVGRDDYNIPPSPS